MDAVAVSYDGCELMTPSCIEDQMENCDRLSKSRPQLQVADLGETLRLIKSACGSSEVIQSFGPGCEDKTVGRSGGR